MPSIARRAAALRRSRILVFLAVGSGPLAAQSTPAKAPAPPTCDAPEYRQFDFWVGSWDVTVGGQPAGTNEVTLEEHGCLVHEHWTGTRGGTGQSLNYFDRQDRQWHQVWVSSTGNALSLAGSYADGTLSYHGETRRPDGTVIQHRLSFHRNADGTVRQFWETSEDRGATWSVAFDGLYRKRSR